MSTDERTRIQDVNDREIFVRHEQSAAVNVSSAGDNIIVAGVAGKRLKVLCFSLQAYGTVQTFWADGSGAAPLTGPYTFQAREGICFGVPQPSILFGTSAGNDLVLNLSGGVQVVGHVTYWAQDES